MTVCQRVAGPIVAGGLVLLPPASAVPPVGGVGGFPGAAFPEYGAPAFVGPGLGGYGGPGPGYAGGYGPAGPGFGGLGAGFIGPGFSGGGSPGPSGGTTVPVAFAANTPAGSPGGSIGNTPGSPIIAIPPTVSITTPGTSVPAMFSHSTKDQSTPGESASCTGSTPGDMTNSGGGSGTTPGSSTPGSSTPGSNTPGCSTTTPGGNTSTPGGGTNTPGGGGNTPGGNTPGGGTTPGGDTPVVDTPEPASIAVLAGALAIVAFFRFRRRTTG